MSEKKNWGYRVVDFFEDYGSFILGLIGGAFAAYSSYLLEAASPDEKLLETIGKQCKSLFENLNNKQYDKGKAVLIVGIVLTGLHLLIGKIEDVRRGKKIRKIEEEKGLLEIQVNSLENEVRTLEENISQANQDFYEVLNYRIAKLAIHKLNLSQEDRISVYRHNSEDKCFSMIGRYSESPYYNEGGRKIYPDNIGFIGKAWHQGKLKVRDLPRYKNGNEDAYYARVSKDGNIPVSVLKKIRMKSSCFYIATIKDRLNFRAVAIVVIESLNPSGLDFDKIDSIFDSIGEQIQHDLDALQRVEPKLSIAKNLGL